MTIGCDLGDRRSRLCLLRESGRPERAKRDTTRAAFRAHFSNLPAAQVMIETGTHSGWVAELLHDLGHQVLVANSRRLRLIAESNQKSDTRDAELLARLGKADPNLLSPVQLRSQRCHRDLLLIRSRDTLVRARTMLVNSVRGLLKAVGERLPACQPTALSKRLNQIPPEFLPAAKPHFRPRASSGRGQHGAEQGGGGAGF